MPSPFTPQDIIALVIDLERGIAPAVVVKHLTRLTAEHAFQNAHADPDKRLDAAEDCPGYLATVSGRWRVFVPWPLAFAFPGAAVLDGLVHVAERSMIDGNGNVALSGSTAFAGRFAALGDIDLAQYVFDVGPTFPERVQQLTERNGSVLARVNFKEEFRPPWQPLVDALNSAVASATTDRMKFDFVDGETPFGLMPVSNIVLPADRNDHTQGAARKSFVFQEAVLVEAGSPPWTLTMADELLRYLRFLVSDIQYYHRQDKPLKALKRALSLSRMIGLDDLASRAETVLCGDAATMTARDSCVEDLNTLWPYLSDEQQAKFATLLKEKKGMLDTITDGETPTEGAIVVVDEVLNRVNELLSREGRSIASWTKQ